MKNLFYCLLLLLPFDIASQETTIAGLSPQGIEIVSPNDDLFCDTSVVTVLFLVNTSTGESTHKTVFQESKGIIQRIYFNEDKTLMREYKEAYWYRYWYFVDGSQVFIDTERVLTACCAKYLAH